MSEVTTRPATRATKAPARQKAAPSPAPTAPPAYRPDKSAPPPTPHPVAVLRDQLRQHCQNILADGLVDALTDLTERGHIWLLTPRVGRDGYVDPTDLAEAALTAGLALANTASVSRNWQAQKLVRPKGGRR